MPEQERAGVLEQERAALNTQCMRTYPKQCCHFGVLIASYGDDDEDEDEDEDEDDDDDDDDDDDLSKKELH